MAATIINYSQISGFFAGEAASESLRNGGFEGADEPLLGQILADLENAQAQAERAAGGASVRDVLLAPNSQRAALFQSYLAQHAVETGQVEDARAGALEAKFDTRDLRWLQAAVPWIRSKLGAAESDPLLTSSRLQGRRAPNSVKGGDSARAEVDAADDVIVDVDADTPSQDGTTHRPETCIM